MLEDLRSCVAKNVSASSCKRLEHEQLVVIGGRGCLKGRGLQGAPSSP